jgi:hypothetical protein
MFFISASRVMALKIEYLLQELPWLQMHCVPFIFWNVGDLFHLLQ